MDKRLTTQESTGENPFTKTFKVDPHTWDTFTKACGEQGLDPYQILRNTVYNYAKIYFELKEEERL